MLKILVTYASAHGTTQSIAERIQTQIRASNIGDVSITSIHENPHLGDFDVVIIGSAIHNGSWLAPASRFLKISALFLKEQPRPTWAFSVGMPKKGAAERGEEESIGKWLRSLVEIKSHKLFQGALQRRDFPCGLGRVFEWFGWKGEDRRDWDAIDAWADGIVEDLRGWEPNVITRHW